MRFLKKHYEKIILSVVLLALGATAVWFYQAVEQVKGETTPESPVVRKTAWKTLDLTKESKALAAFNVPPELDLSAPNKLFNPLTWKLRTNTLYVVGKEGADALLVTSITPVFFTISYDRKAGDSYMMTVTPGVGRPRSGYAIPFEKDKSKPFIITGTNDAPDGTSTLTLSITDTGTVETVTVTTNKPYKRIDSFTADLSYPPDNTTFLKQRTNDSLTLSGEPYKIIAITNNAVTVQEIKTSLRTPIQWNGAH